MYGREDSKCAAVFDFDGVFFQPDTSWKIANPSMGVVGSRIPCKEGYRRFEEIRREEPDAELDEYFVPDEFEYEAVDEEQNVLPISNLLHCARHHIFRRDDILIAVPPGFLGLIVKRTERVFEQLKNFMLFENPFRRANRIYLPEEAPLPFHDYAGRPGLKAEFYAAYLKYSEGREERNRLIEHFNPAGVFYNKLFLYHTERALELKIQNMLHRDLERLTDGRNAVVPMYIAHIPE